MFRRPFSYPVHASHGPHSACRRSAAACFPSACAQQPLDVLSFGPVASLTTTPFRVVLCSSPVDSLSAFWPESLIFRHYLMFHSGQSHHGIFKVKPKITTKRDNQKSKCSSGLQLPPAAPYVAPNHMGSSLWCCNHQTPTKCKHPWGQTGIQT